MKDTHSDHSFQGPHFICVGPEKTGTSWLYKNLEHHPQVFLPPVKEVRYFWERLQYPDEGVIGRFRKKDWHNEFYRRFLRMLIGYYARNYIRLSAEKRFKGRWLFRYLFLPHTDRWYQSLFHIRTPRISGDISPQYLLLPESEIARIHAMFPESKIIIFHRNPLDRMWSFAKMILCRDRGRQPDEVPEAEFMTFFQEMKDGFDRVGLEAPGLWKKYYSDEQVFEGFYDELLEDPWGFYCRLCSFLKIDPEQLPGRIRKELDQRRNVGIRFDMPEQFRQYLQKEMAPLMKEMSERYGSYPEKWLGELS